MTQTIAALRKRIPDCRLADRFRFKRRLDRLAKQPSADGKLQALADEIAASIAGVELRRGQNAPIHYPDLPVCARRDEILAAIRDHQVVVIAGETGSGKTTQLPKLCLELGFGCGALIGHTQPRRLAARAVASRIAEELQSELGGRVGYQVRHQDQLSERTQIKVMTDGILLAETQHDRRLEQYDVIIIDEAHERSLNIDFLLGYLKRLLPQRPDLKLIITSATIDLERFSRHFDNAPILEVSGRTYPVELRYRPPQELLEGDDKGVDQPRAILAAVQELQQAERGGSARGDILVFLSGEREIRETAELLRRAQLRDTEVLPLYARLSNAEQNRIFHPSGRGRRIVLATNVAETSLTVPGIRYVIDPGYARISRYSYRSKVQRLPIEPISQASANQRAGRCGRVAEGICIRLYSEEDFNSRPSFTDAEILRTNLASVILQMAAQKLGAMEAFPFIDPPDGRQVRDGIRLLEELGAMQQGRLSPLGQRLARLPVDPRLGRMLLEAERKGCVREMLVLTAVLGMQDPRERPLDKQTQADQCHAEYRDEQSDFITLLNLWQRYEAQRQELSQSQLRKYCQQHYLSFLRMREWRDLHRQLWLACKAQGMQQNSGDAGYAAIHQALLSGLLGQIGLRQENREYLGARNRKFMVFPGSPLSKAKLKWIVAAELVETSRLFARMVARIEPQWVEALAPHLVRRSYSEPHWEKQRRDVVASEQVTLYGLVIVPRRSVSFGRIDPDTAQQIFIRQALVEGDYASQAPFFTHNRALLDEVAALEDKTRRRDILVDEEQLYDFYRERLQQQGGEAVVNGASFESWRKRVEADQPQLLFFSKAALVRDGAPAVSEVSYPDALVDGSLRYRLHYQFQPGSEADGVTVEVPLAALKRLPLARLEWLVPGLLEEKCIALLKQLPKALRKQFVPVPDYVRAFLQSQPDTAKPLTEQLAAWLKRRSGVMIEAADWQPERLPEHLRFNIRVLDRAGNPLGEGRDWQALNQRFATEAANAADAPDPERAGWERRVVNGVFPPLPAQVTLRQAGMQVPAYPALNAEEQGVWVRLFDAPQAARRAHLEGLLTLLAESEQPWLKECRRRWQSRFESCALRLAAALPKERLWHDLARRTLLDAYIKEAAGAINEAAGAIKETAGDINEATGTTREATGVIKDAAGPANGATGAPQQAGDGVGYQAWPRSGAELAALAQQQRGELAEQFEHNLRLLEQIATLYQPLTKELKGSVQLPWVPVLNDIRGQLEQLFQPGFLTATPALWLRRYPIYLQALGQRLQRFKADLQRQRLASDELQQHWQRYAARRQQVSAAGGDEQQLLRYRWMLEEYRVSLFAQQLGTLMPVSSKRLAQQWRLCEG